MYIFSKKKWYKLAFNTVSARLLCALELCLALLSQHCAQVASDPFHIINIEVSLFIRSSLFHV